MQDAALSILLGRVLLTMAIRVVHIEPPISHRVANQSKNISHRANDSNNDWFVLLCCQFIILSIANIQVFVRKYFLSKIIF